MAIDPRQLRPTELVRLLNSTPRGEVIGERQLLRHRARAGFRIGDDRHVDLFRYVAWLVVTRHEPGPEPEADPYAAMKERARARNIALSMAGRDIGEIPAVVNPERRARAERDFRFFCETYFAAAFTLAWSEDHVRVIAKIERAVLAGGLFGHAMPRGSGKTTLTSVACVWAILFGHCPFVCLVAAASERARSLLGNIKTWFETNPLLMEDFPEVVYPIRKLGRIANRQLGQTCQGEPTRIEWTADKIVLATIPGSRASGSVMSTAGMKGSEIRGQSHALADGTIIRPRLAVIDDPQTTESAWSLTQSQQREAILASDILGMAGPGQKIAAIMCCTVIRQGDMADNLLDREKHPLWQGERTKMVYVFPSNEALWARYAEIRAASYRADGDGAEATEFYREHRDEMDAGAIVAWPERHNADEISAVQHAMNLKLRDETAFWAEYQNEPRLQSTTEILTPEHVANKLSGLARRVVPKSAEHVTAFIDVGGEILWWIVCAWTRDFAGGPIDYGTYPRQPADYFSKSSLPITLADVHPGMVDNAYILAGLNHLCDKLMSEQFVREDGASMHIGRMLIDARWGAKSELVKAFCRRRAEYGTRIMPSMGGGFGATAKAITEYRPEPGAVEGGGRGCPMHWRIGVPKAGDRWVTIDTNWWKDQATSRLVSPHGTPGGWELFGNVPREHALIADHWTSEEPVEVIAKNRTFNAWRLKPNRRDNDWWDCLIGAAVAASWDGAVFPDVTSPQPLAVQGSWFANQKRRR